MILKADKVVFTLLYSVYNTVVQQNLHENISVEPLRAVINHLGNQYPGRWIAHNGPVSWPVRSPDPTSYAFCLWRHMKERVCSQRNETILRNATVAAGNAIHDISHI